MIVAKELHKEDKFRDFSWVAEQQKNKKLEIQGYVLSDEVFEQFRLLVKCTQEIFTDLWDLDIIDSPSLSGNYRILGVIIRFPEILIKNSQKKEHLIKELFVKIHLSMDNKKLKIYSLSGGRAQLSYEEFFSNYMHSHLPGVVRLPEPDSPMPYYSSFCRGTGHINSHMMDINSDGISEDSAMKFLVQLLGFVSWESLEGVPHRLMGNIRPPGSSGRRYFRYNKNSVISNFQDLVTRVKDAPDRFIDLDFIIENNSYVLVNNDKLDEFISSNVITSDRSIFLCYLDNNGTYYSYDSPGPQSIATIPPIRNQNFIFQGETIEFQVTDIPKTTDVEKIEYTVYPEVKEIIKEYLEYEINSKKIRASLIKRYESKVSDAIKSTEPDKVVV